MEHAMDGSLVEALRMLADMPRLALSYGWMAGVGVAVFATAWSFAVDLGISRAANPRGSGEGGRRG